jgi:hypothetical protein
MKQMAKGLCGESRPSEDEDDREVLDTARTREGNGLQAANKFSTSADVRVAATDCARLSAVTCFGSDIWLRNDAQVGFRGFPPARKLGSGRLVGDSRDDDDVLALPPVDGCRHLKLGSEL